MSAPNAMTAQSRAPIFQLLRISEVCSTVAPVSHIIEAILPTESLVVLVGAPGAGKTLLALDWALSLNTLASWHTFATYPTEVLYIAGEGRRGLRGRVLTWQERSGVSDIYNVRLLSRAFPLGEIAAHRELCHSLLIDPSRDNAGFRPGLIVVDTLSANAPHGFDENSTRDMKMLLDGARMLRDEFGATVLLLHHPGWGSERPRGARDLEGAADVVMHLKRTNDAGHLLTCAKSRDAEPFAPVPMQLARVGSGVVLAPVEAALAVSTGKALTPAAVVALEALRRTVSPCRSTEWQRASALGGSTFHKVRDTLLTDGFVMKSGNKYELTQAGHATRGEQ